MASFSDRAAGLLMLLVSLSVFLYYTLWVMVTPFLSANSSALSFFPDRYWAVAIPVILLVGGLSAIGAYLGSVMIKSGQKKKAS